MRIEIEIPKEFEEHFKQDKFEDSLNRLYADVHLLAGKYERELAEMLIKAFRESKPAYSVDKVVERMSDLYIEARLQAIKDIASASCVDIKDADNIASFCDEIYSAIPNIDRIVEELEKIEQHCLDIVKYHSNTYEGIYWAIRDIEELLEV